MNNTIEINTGNDVVSPLEAIVNKLTIQSKQKEDFVVPSGFIRYDGISGLLNINNEFDYGVTEHTHFQIAQKLEIPGGYYNKMRIDNQDLLAININSWLSRKEKTKYLLRTFNYSEEGINNVCRAMLSDRYAILDNMDVLLTALEAIKKTGIHVEIIKAEVTERRMYLHIVSPEIHIEATELLNGYLENEKIETDMLHKGIISGIIISNSEVGLGTFEIGAAAQIIVCKNRMVDRSSKFRKVHLGSRLDNGIVNWSQNTKNKNYELIMAQVQDSVKTYLSKEYLGQLTTKLFKHKEEKIENPNSVIQAISNELMIGDQHRQNILKYFYRDGDDSAFGLMNSFTRESQTMLPDMQFDVESGIFDLLPQFKSFDKKLSKN